MLSGACSSGLDSARATPAQPTKKDPAACRDCPSAPPPTTVSVSRSLIKLASCNWNLMNSGARFIPRIISVGRAACFSFLHFTSTSPAILVANPFSSRRHTARSPAVSIIILEAASPGRHVHPSTVHVAHCDACLAQHGSRMSRMPCSRGGRLVQCAYGVHCPQTCNFTKGPAPRPYHGGC
jgi:hypothetical protein